VIYQTISFAGFGRGLNLNDKEDAVAEDQCIDCMNVEFTERGAVRQRDGYEVFTDAELTNRARSAMPFENTSGTNQLVVGCGSRVDVLDASGTLTSSLTGMDASGIWDFARFGAPGRELIFAGNGKDAIRQWDGSAWSLPKDYSVSPAVEQSTVPKAGALAGLSVDQGNRLLAGRFLTTTGGPDGSANSSNPSRIYYSAAGDPSDWPTNQYVDFAPGDGEVIQALVSWNQYVFVFKETKFMVIYGTYEDAGFPVLNWRTIDTGVGLVGPRAVCTTSDGVYFLSQNGVYRTNGEVPEMVSTSVSPVFDPQDTASIYWLGGQMSHQNVDEVCMGSFNDRVYISFPTGDSLDENAEVTNDRIMVFDPTYGWWTIWTVKYEDTAPTPDVVYDAGASFIVSWNTGSRPRLTFGFSDGPKHVGQFENSLASDDGYTIESHWRSGWFNYGSSDTKTIRESKIWANGELQISVSQDFEANPGTVDSFSFPSGGGTQWSGSTWSGGTWSAPTGLFPQLRRRAIQGTQFSTTIANNYPDRGFSLHRLTHHLREFRIPSVPRRTEQDS